MGQSNWYIAGRISVRKIMSRFCYNNWRNLKCDTLCAHSLLHFTQAYIHTYTRTHTPSEGYCDRFFYPFVMAAIRIAIHNRSIHRLHHHSQHTQNIHNRKQPHQLHWLTVSRVKTNTKTVIMMKTEERPFHAAVDFYLQMYWCKVANYLYNMCRNQWVSGLLWFGWK